MNPYSFRAGTVEKTMIYGLFPIANSAFIGLNITPFMQGIVDFNSAKSDSPE